MWVWDFVLVVQRVCGGFRSPSNGRPVGFLQFGTEDTEWRAWGSEGLTDLAYPLFLAEYIRHSVDIQTLGGLSGAGTCFLSPVFRVEYWGIWERMDFDGLTGRLTGCVTSLGRQYGRPLRCPGGGYLLLSPVFHSTFGGRREGDRRAHADFTGLFRFLGCYSLSWGLARA